MRRRDFITIVGGAAAAWPLAAQAQQADRVRRIAVLQAFDAIDPEAQRRIEMFLRGLQELGWTDGRNVRIDYRWAGTDPERIRSFAVELVGLKPDVILASSSLVLRPLQRETRTIPIVFTQVTDPVGSGFVASLSRPGGNITGFAPAEFPMAGKSLEVLREMAPRVRRVAVILNPDQTPQVGMWRAIEAVAPLMSAQVTAAEVRKAADIERAIEASAHEPNGGLIVLPNPLTTVHRDLIIALAAKHGLPAIYAYRFFVTGGGLMSYGIDPADQFRQAAAYVDRILRGEQPGDLPVQQPTKFELVINLKTAKALGLTAPPTVLARADEVIE